MAQHPHLPRVTYTNIGADFSGLHDFLDEAIPRARESLGRRIDNLIGGRPDADGEPYAATSPIDDRVTLGHCLAASPAAAQRAVAAARAAFPGWARRPWRERVAILEEANRRLAERRFDLGLACLWEVGKSRFEAMGEAEEALDLIPFYAAEMARNDGYVRTLATAVPGETGTTRLRPYGVFAVIGPYNFPIATPINMIVAALITGNTVVYKPSRGAGLTAGLIADCLLGSGLPEGAFNLICGDDATGRALIAAGVDGAAITGSMEAGHAIHAELARGPGVRPVIAEMGGKNATIVAASADLDAAAEGLVRSAYGLQGQKCSACEVAYIDASVWDALTPMIAARTRALGVGDPARREVFVGPLIDARAGAAYARAAEEARRDGTILAGGARLSGGAHDHGVYVEPLLTCDLPPGHRHLKEELFLPYLTLQKTGSLDEAIERANATAYGLTAGFYGRDGAELERFLERMEAGTLYANRRSGATTGAWPGVQSFGGWKGSGLTGKNAFGPHYLPLFMREQNRTLMAT
ncbi:MAG: aldehyde dehydrogenase family protein [Methylobacteriaceae bacterium]|nr:aldehyde dehydrogenase family protein [Methylobacteriaceae bacterium]